MLKETSTSFTCSDLKSIPQLRDAKLRAGSEGLTRVITRVNIMEVPDVIHWVQSHEFLVTTGYPFKDKPDFLEKFIPQLVKKGVSAIGIKTKRFIEEIPKEALEIANQYHFPIFELPPSTVFSNVVREVMEQIISRDTAKVTILQDRIHQLTQSILFNDSIDTLLMSLEKMLGNPVILVNRTSRVYATSHCKKIMGDMPLWNIRHNHNDYIHHPFIILNDKKIKIHLTHIHDHEVNDSVLILLEKNHELSVIDKLTIERVCFLIRFVILNARSRLAIASKYMDQFLQDWLLGGVVNLNDLKLREKSLDHHILGDDCHYRAIIVNWNKQKPEIDQLTKIIDEFRLSQRRRVNLTVTLAAGEMVFISISSKSYKGDLNHKMSHFLKTIALNLPFSLCIGKSVKNPLHLHQSYIQAKNIQQVIQKCTISDDYVTYDKLGIYQILYLLPDCPERTAFESRFMVPLLDYEQKNNTPLIATMMCYFKNNGNVKRTAEQMYTHYNTILYRLERIKEILNVRLDDEKDSLQIQIALKLFQMNKEKFYQAAPQTDPNQ
ncbi:PucR family transcriptional regulator [Sporolactobacillus sp. THM7-7]|nr:PucR family transcriptional regulator [Sporolactobacillus sp. THM7-7]